MGKLIQPCVHLSPYVCDALIKFLVKLVRHTAKDLLWFLDLPCLRMQAFLDFTPELIQSLFVRLKRLLLSDKVQILGTCSSRQLLIQNGEFVLKLQLQCLHHLLHLNYLCLAIQYRLYLSPTWFLIQSSHCKLFVELCLHPLIELFESGLAFDLRLKFFKFFQDCHSLLLLFSLRIFCSFL